MNTIRRFVRAGARVCVASWLLSCGGDSPVAPDAPVARDLVIVTNIIGASSASAFVGTAAGITAAAFDNAKAQEITPYPYVFVRGSTVMVTGNGSTDVLKKFVPGADGHLVPAGQLPLGAGAGPAALVWASDTKAYVSLSAAGKIAVVNPSTMTLLKTIDLSGPRWAIGDNNPDPDQLVLRDGKLFVALQQWRSMPVGHDTVDVLMIDATADTVEKLIRDTRTATAGGEGNSQKMFVDEAGDIYLVCVSSYGYNGNKPHGVLRIRAGAADFDPSYFLDLNAITAAAGERVDYINMAVYAGNGLLYATGDVPSRAHNPPDFVNDYTFKSLRIDLRQRTVTTLALPLSNGYSATVGLYKGKVLFGLATKTGVGIYTYDPATNTASTSPAVSTQGFPSAVRELAP